MHQWTAFPYDRHPYLRDRAALEAHWPRLHAGDAEPFPRDARVQAAWALFHAGDFQQAHLAGLDAGAAGITVANKAQLVHATHLEPSEKVRRAMLQEVADRAEAQAADEPANPNAHYLMADALCRHGQALGVAQAMAEDLGGRIRAALETAIALQPRHADAHTALGAFHAEIIDKLGSLLGRTQGAQRDTGLALLRTAVVLNPHSPGAKLQYAHGLVMLEGPHRMGEATALYEQAAACQPADAAERLEVEAAQAELED